MLSRIMDTVVGFPRIGGIQRAYNWSIMLPDMTGTIIPGVAVSKYCQAVSLAPYTVSEISELRRGAFKKHFPAKLDIDSVRCIFVAPTPDIITLYFEKWRSLMFDYQGRWNVSSKYKKQMYVFLWDRSGIPVNVIKLTGVFPTKFPALELDYSAEKPVTYHVDFKIDWAEYGVEALSTFKEDLGSGIKNLGKPFGSLGSS